jgi:hypothetical protein
MKYPRTYHLPWSPGATSDDKRLQDGWFDFYKGKEVVFTEKLDGENTAMTHYDVYARSHGAPTRSPWSRNLWDQSDGLYWKIKQYIGPNETIYGENLYGEHSIHYDRLPAYFFTFACRRENQWWSWDDVVLMADILHVPTVPVLWRGKLESESQLKEMISKFMSEPSAFGDTKEGVVIRKTGSFDNSDFSRNVAKWVRENHVQTDEHWTKNWKRAKLITETI